MYRYLPLLIAVALIPGCGALIDLLGPWIDGSPFGPETGSSTLKAFSSEQELTDYFSRQISVRNDHLSTLDFFREGSPALDTGNQDMIADAPDAAPPLANEGGTGAPEGGSADSQDDDFSQTTIQEEGVDEADVVKTDGTYLYIIDNAQGDSVLRIVRVSPPEELALLSELPLEGYGTDIYLHDGKVVALTATGGGFYFFGGGGGMIDVLPEPDIGVAISSETVGDNDGSDNDDEADAESDVVAPDEEPDRDGEYQYQRPRTVVTVVDVTTPDSPTVLSQTKFDGSHSSSRMVDGVLHMVISNRQDYYYDVMPMLGQPGLDVDTIEVEMLLPKFEQVDSESVESSGGVVTWQNLYRPTDPDGFGVVTLVSLDVDNKAAFTATGIVAEPGLIYSSLNALYLSDTEYDFLGDTRETTDIYKFAYVDRGAVPVATGSVPGRILNQYSMGEHEGHLRVATTVGATWSLFGGRSGPYNNVYVLAQTEEGLEIVGSVQNLAPGETIQSARFLGDRGYLVTFEQIDPLYTLDLSDPTNPRVVGELKVPGYSTFIVPMDADHLLTVGQYIPDEGPFFGWGVQLSIFDVSDFANPQRTENVILGEMGGASSEALYNPKAFTYFTERGLVALPVSIYEDRWFIDGITAPTEAVPEDDDEPGDATSEPGGDEVIDTGEPYVPESFDGLIVYSVSVEEGLDELGRISTRFNETGYYWSSFTRGVFIGDNVFAVTSHGVRGAPVSNPSDVPYELPFAAAP